MTVEDRLHAAIEDGEVLRITYAGGSQPGAERDIAPISIKDGKVRARCYSSNAVKMFVIDKVSLVGASSSTSENWTPGKAVSPQYRTTDDIVESMKNEWVSAGWHIEKSSEHVGLHMYGKHKKLLKYPTVSIYYDPEINELHMDLGGNFVQPDRKREKPWVVSAKDMSTVAYKHFDKAAEKFIERTRQITPNPTPPK
ncbi:hypothetical protein [Spongiibacter sp.]|uniref:hypothetical protein n=1 Tax=Spongiibacter sp. TaxID=2024860 RepID=UPI000C56A5DB|nr:hypothetical protein [Spongiibacter sp.]MBU71847.1 hypothetical protein [Spongiibacter sp.]HCP19593.1 hypothetical protein [Marinobacter nauticus]|tara:strand:- start:20798 stop:21388 length:591 start_codon:yes stop_codon:yes gene_type:complete